MKTLCSRTEYSLSCRQDITPQFTPSIHSDWENLRNRLQALRLKGLKNTDWLSLQCTQTILFLILRKGSPRTRNTLTTKKEGKSHGRIRGGGAGGSAPLFCHDVGFLTLSPKLDPLLDPPFSFLLVDLKWPPPHFKKSWIRPELQSNLR